MGAFKWLGSMVQRRYGWVLLAGAVLIVVAVFGATRVKMESAMGTFLSADSQTYKDYARFGQDFGGNAVVVLVEADSASSLLTPGNLQALDGLETTMAADARLVTVVGPALMVKQAVAKQSGAAAIPPDASMISAIVLDPATGQVRPEMRPVFPDGAHALVSMVPRGDLTAAQQKDVIAGAKAAVAAAGLQGTRTVVSGGMSTIFDQIEGSMRSSLPVMLGVAVGIMLLILALVFGVRGVFLWRWLPLGIVAISLVYTFGVMGFISVPITMVTMAIFPILVGLGADYAIQIHNRYDEEAARGSDPGAALTEAITHIGPAIGIAIVTACLGFGALFFSPVPMVRDFGKMLLIGVVACYAVSTTLLLAVLFWRERRAQRAGIGDKPRAPAARRAAPVERALAWAARPVIRSPFLILPVALALTAAGLFVDSRITTETDWTSFLSPDLQAVKEVQALERVAGDLAPASVLVEAPDVTDPAVVAWVLEAQQRIQSAHPGAVRGVNSYAGLVMQAAGGKLPPDSASVRAALAAYPPSVTRNLVSGDFQAANLVVSTGEMDTGSWRRLRTALEEDIASPPAGVTASLTGSPVLGVELLDALTGGRVKMTLIGVGFIFCGLLALFRLNLLRALLATLPVGLVLGWSSGLMFLAGIKYTPATATLGALVLGIGTEFTILLMMRYYEERGRGTAPEEAMTVAMTRIGRAIIASGLTVVGGFAALLMARDFPILQDFGIVTMASVGFALASTLVVLPPLIVWIDSWREKREAKAGRRPEEKARAAAGRT